MAAIELLQTVVTIAAGVVQQVIEMCALIICLLCLYTFTPC